MPDRSRKLAASKRPSGASMAVCARDLHQFIDRLRQEEAVLRDPNQVAERGGALQERRGFVQLHIQQRRQLSKRRRPQTEWLHHGDDLLQPRCVLGCEPCRVVWQAEHEAVTNNPIGGALGPDRGAAQNAIGHRREGEHQFRFRHAHAVRVLRMPIGQDLLHAMPEALANAPVRPGARRRHVPLHAREPRNAAQPAPRRRGSWPGQSASIPHLRHGPPITIRTPTFCWAETVPPDRPAARGELDAGPGRTDRERNPHRRCDGPPRRAGRSDLRATR